MDIIVSKVSEVSIFQWLLVIIVLCVTLEFISTLLGTRTPRYPWVNHPWLPRLLAPKHAHEYVEVGYERFTRPLNQPFKMIWWAQECIFLPAKYLQDLKGVNSAKLDFFESLSSAFSLRYSVGDLYESDIMIEVLRKYLNPRLPTLIPLLDDECDFAMGAEIGAADGWTTFIANKLLSRVMHRMTCRILLDRELCRDEHFVHTSLKFMNSVVTNALLSIMFPLGPFRGVCRSMLAYFHCYNLESAVRLVLPMVEKRLQERELGEKRAIHVDATEWIITLAGSDPKESDPRRITLNLLHNIWAGSAGPAALVSQMLYQVLMMPEYMEPLRNEAREATRNHGWTDKALSSMCVQDSFIKEVNRMYPLGSVTAARTIMEEPFQFHDGLVLPVGTRIAFPIGAMQRDPANFSCPTTFNGFRFVNSDPVQYKSQGEEAFASAQTVSTTNLAFGYGKHACPGRFYAIRKVKLAFSKLILNFDIKWDSPRRARPVDFPVEGQFAPNLEQKIRLKRRSGATHT